MNGYNYKSQCWLGGRPQQSIRHPIKTDRFSEHEKALYKATPADLICF